MDKATLLACAPAGANPSALRWLLRRVYCGNPFYVISADLVFVGLRMSLDSSGKSLETWALLVSLLGYTLLLATTAYVLIRMGSVWDDVRTLLLLVVGMFLAISVTFDETLARNPRLGMIFFVGGLLFAVAVSEGLLRGIRLRLPAFYRAPYYLILSLFFLYPIALTPLLGDPESEALQWALFGFSTLAGRGVSQPSMPAVKAGGGIRSEEWESLGVIRFILGCSSGCWEGRFVVERRTFASRFTTSASPTRSSVLTFSSRFCSWWSCWCSRRVSYRGTAPHASAVALIGLSALPFLAMAGPRHDPVYQSFLSLFMSELGGSPLYLTLLAVRGRTCRRGDATGSVRPRRNDRVAARAYRCPPRNAGSQRPRRS